MSGYFPFFVFNIDLSPLMVPLVKLESMGR